MYGMSLHEILSAYGIFTLLLLALVAFASGFIDAVVGGGGLIQLPFLLINFPKIPLPVIFGTNKIAALCGTSVAAAKYAAKIKFNFKLLFVISAFCFVSSFAGAQVVDHLNPNVLKPLILVILIIVAIYTFVKKSLGVAQSKD